MWFHLRHPFYHGIVLATVVGLGLGAIVSSGFHVDAVETSPERCQDRVVALSASSKCPHGTYLELQSDGVGKRYVVCHCSQPANVTVTIQVPPSQEQDDPGPEVPFDLQVPKVDPPRKPIQL